MFTQFLYFFRLRRGSVIANFTIFYWEINSAQVVLMQHAIEEDKFINDMPLQKVNITTNQGTIKTTVFIFWMLRKDMDVYTSSDGKGGCEERYGCIYTSSNGKGRKTALNCIRPLITTRFIDTEFPIS